jgi:hypothetical protein
MEKPDTLIWKTGCPVFTTLASCLIFFHLDPFMPFNPFFASKHLESSNLQV